MDTLPSAVGRRVRQDFGTPPADHKKCYDWLWHNFAVVLQTDPRFPVQEVLGLVRRSNYRDVQAVITTGTDVPLFRWMIAHELGHVLVGTIDGFALLREDVQHWQRLPEEKIATQFATTLLLDLCDVTDRLRMGWTLSQVARYSDVPDSIVLLRIKLADQLGEDFYRVPKFAHAWGIA